MGEAMHTTRMGAPQRPVVTFDDWICVRSGRKFHFEALTDNHVHLTDIATALARIARYGGHGERKYTVAEHSLRVHDAVLVHYLEKVCDEIEGQNNLTEFGMTERISECLFNAMPTIYRALIHDAAEAFMGDKVAPLKQYMAEFKQKEEAVELVIFRALYNESTIIDKAFGQGVVIDKAIVKEYDLRMLRTEKIQLLPWYPDDPWRNDNVALVDCQWRFEPVKRPYKRYAASRTETEEKVRTHFYEWAHVYYMLFNNARISGSCFEPRMIQSLRVCDLIDSLYSKPARVYLRRRLANRQIPLTLSIRYPAPRVSRWTRIKRSLGFYPRENLQPWGSNL